MKQFEAALGIVQTQAEKCPNHDIENNSAKLAESGLMPVNVAAIDGARTNDDIGALFERDIEKSVHFLDGCGKIGVREQNELTGRGENTLPHRVPFAVIFIVANKTKTLDIRLAHHG